MPSGLSMNDKEVKQVLKDAAAWMSDASKAWPRYPEIAKIRFDAALERAEVAAPYLELYVENGKEG